MSKASPLGGPYITKTTVITAILTAIMGALLLYRLVFGLGAVTNLSNGYGFGLWIAYDVFISTAFACGGYSMAILVYIFNKGEFHPLVRPALLASAFGYSLGGMSIMFDIGRYWNAWHLFLPAWANTTSIMLEVACCIGAYCCVLWVEFAPVIAAKWGTPKIQKMLTKTAFIPIAVGCLLPTMHQSSLGSLLIPAGYLVHPLWQTNVLPLLALSSAICMGYSIVIFEGSLVAEAYNRPSEAPMLGKISRIISWLLIFYLVVRWGNLIYANKLGLVLTSGKYSAFFIIENVLFLLPIILLASQRTRFNPQILFIAAVSMLLAGALYRLDLVLIAYGREGWHYFPSIGEILITVGFVALEILGYIVCVRLFPVLSSHHPASGSDSHSVRRAPSVAATTNK
ncbi:Ni/Fe-hydrogenase cytochrome b subunit [Telmatospirillum sp.]|uniref:Ni/Fe-hydrogenase cytochrome b subunit n=1 Tax=Telmatospirillum sp. TaxID=2079197 RepID=UPI00284B7465|nr:Ni/Fe-hydrogenase cytochrome b subunit [Telmatospirillum sp.]MDR3435179.1 Ni/Fe-hydrogenase cytochrome b subunit [Telmatospirillum sp.]